jgi:hypothetical protein
MAWKDFNDYHRQWLEHGSSNIIHHDVAKEQ